MIRKYLAARNLDAFIRNSNRFKNEPPLPPGVVRHAELAITGLHRALLQRDEPTCTKPDYPFNAWELTTTPYAAQGFMFGTPTALHIGDRSFYLNDRTPGDLLRVLSIPHPRVAADTQIVRVGRTTIAGALAESPSLYHGFMDAADELIKECGLTYEIPLLDLPRDIPKI